jgi:hypothetical protein
MKAAEIEQRERAFSLVDSAGVPVEILATGNKHEHMTVCTATRVGMFLQQSGVACGVLKRRRI